MTPPMFISIIMKAWEADPFEQSVRKKWGDSYTD